MRHLCAQSTSNGTLTELLRLLTRLEIIFQGYGSIDVVALTFRIRQWNSDPDLYIHVVLRNELQSEQFRNVYIYRPLTGKYAHKANASLEAMHKRHPLAAEGNPKENPKAKYSFSTATSRQ